MTNEAIEAALVGAMHEAGFIYYEDMAAALLPVVRRIAEQRAAEAMTETATKWQYGAWIDLPPSVGSMPNRLRIAQFVTDWLRARAAALTATPNHGRNAT